MIKNLNEDLFNEENKTELKAQAFSILLKAINNQPVEECNRFFRISQGRKCIEVAIENDEDFQILQKAIEVVENEK